MKELLELKKKMKKKKPNFIRQDAHKKKRLGGKWRKPKGLQSKMRLSLKGYRKTVKLGYRKPKQVRSLHKSGLKGVNVNNVSNLNTVDSKTEGVIISRIGLKKKIDIVKKAIEMKIKIFNIRNPELFLKETKERLEKKSEEKKKVVKEKEERKKGREKAEKEKKKDELTEKIEKEEEKKEKDKLLTKKEIK